MSDEATWVMGEATIVDPTGLHARPAVRLTKCAKAFDADVELMAEGGERWVNAKSPNAVMKLKAGAQTRLRIRASGPDAEQAVAALAGLVLRDFRD